MYIMHVKPGTYQLIISCAEREGLVFDDDGEGDGLKFCNAVRKSEEDVNKREMFNVHIGKLVQTVSGLHFVLFYYRVTAAAQNPPEI